MLAIDIVTGWGERAWRTKSKGKSCAKELWLSGTWERGAKRTIPSFASQWLLELPSRYPLQAGHVNDCSGKHWTVKLEQRQPTEIVNVHDTRCTGAHSRLLGRRRCKTLNCGVHLLERFRHDGDLLFLMDCGVSGGIALVTGQELDDGGGIGEGTGSWRCNLR
jgi:hypothetical protein